VLGNPEQGDSLGLTQERFGFTLFISVCVHAVLILGIGFTVSVAPKVVSNIQVTLAAYRSAEAPKDADFLAQANQQGSGTEDKALAPSTPFTSPFVANKINKLEQFLQERPTTPAQDNAKVVSRDGGVRQQDSKPTPPQTDVTKMNGENLGDAVASLQAQLDLHRQEYAKRPRRYTISSASTKESSDATYLDAWRKRIEGIGNVNYPLEASSNGIYGSLRLLVAINPDGTVSDIRILRSSGERILDEAAVRIVQLSAPFPPFPPELRKQVDVLEIIRTWQFQRGNTFSSY
jgi:periplasmic protein TonB